MTEIRRPSGVVQEQRAIWMAVRLCLFLTFPAALPGAQEANRSRRFGPDSCGPVDPAYISKARAGNSQFRSIQASKGPRSRYQLTPREP